MASTPLDKGHPLMQAWERYRSSERYANAVASIIAYALHEGGLDLQDPVHSARFNDCLARLRASRSVETTSGPAPVLKVDGVWDEGDATFVNATPLLEPAEAWRSIVEGGGYLYALPAPPGAAPEVSGPPERAFYCPSCDYHFTDAEPQGRKDWPECPKCSMRGTIMHPHAEPVETQGEREREEVEGIAQYGFVAGYRGGYHDGASGNHEDPELAWEDYYSALPWVQDERARATPGEETSDAG